MFEEPRKEPPASADTKPQHGGGKLPYVLGGLVTVLLIAVAFLTYKVLAMPDYTVPKDIAKKISYPIFAPKKLPQGYKVAEDSFTVSEGTLVFQAQDSSGSSIAFTEQKKPDNFDFEKFYQEQMQNAKRLDNTPYPSVTGKPSAGASTLLSVVTPKTWVLVSTGAPLDEQDLAAIAKGLKQY